ncbi:S8 family serine peptidase [Paracoccus tibetensis]|uniref:Subtilase family protein n=1 Tax=Paracoccus tibetensis TaxID=336292 RepID=A0A1G5FNB4_9RHOB|nr:S8 family serine peptidase [Paracoccus tibetensis]SCY40852.1 Subtilase family protein [Paracoccus tibetensis]
MLQKTRPFAALAAAAALIAAVAGGARAEGLSFAPALRDVATVVPASTTALRLPGAVTLRPAVTPVYRRWMSPEIRTAWNAGFRGQNTRIVVVDDFTSSDRFSGNFGAGETNRRHGYWVRQQAGMIAPAAEFRTLDYYSNERVTARSTGLTVVNLSYGIFGRPGMPIIESELPPQERSIIRHARLGTAVVVQAAGNDGVAVGTMEPGGDVDYLSLALIGKQSAIFVGALDRNGTVTNKARIESYSNRAGGRRAVQDRFLMVGVRDDVTGLAGTSFAAPIVSGYAAVLGSKFRGASATQISNRLLNTARTDTIRNYRRDVHGRGEASIGRAIAPSRID